MSGGLVEIARQIGREVGIVEQVLAGAALERLEDEQLADAVEAALRDAKVVLAPAAGRRGIRSVET